MKKIFLSVLLSVLFTFSLAQESSAINFDKIVGKVASDSTKDVSSKIEKKFDKIVKKAEGELDQYKADLDGEIKKYKNKIDSETKKIEKIIAETEDSINKIKHIKNNISYYINIVKIVLAILCSGFLILIFVLWRVWCNIKNLKKLAKNVSNYDDFDRRLKQVEGSLTKS
ncbi:MAG: putative PurR-regulated permease PerM [Rickettsiales bacterium]|jgi:predicted PurR-regulated permease PerM